MKKIKLKILSIILRIVLNIIFLTCRWKVYNVNLLHVYIASPQPILLCSWHQRFLYVAKYFQNFGHCVYAISSTHEDSEIMAKILRGWRWKLIRGSSTRGWQNVIKKMISLFKKQKTIIAITNDGPKGPARVAKKGSIDLAIKSNAHIMAMSCCASSFWTLSSWDKTHIPKPFSTIYIQFSSPIKQNKSNNSSTLVSQYLNKSLTDLDKKIKK